MYARDLSVILLVQNPIVGMKIPGVPSVPGVPDATGHAVNRVTHYTGYDLI